MGIALLALTVALGLFGCALSVVPVPVVVSGALEGFSRLSESAPLGRVAANTLGPAAISVLLIQLPLAYAGALGISGLRPLGRWSEALLLLFSPWLFVSARPLSIAFFERARDSGSLDSFAGLFPPIAISLPMLFILALFFKGQAPKWSAARQSQPGGRAFFETLILPSLPLAGLLACAALFVALQDLWWPLLVSRGMDNATAAVLLVNLVGQFTPGPLAAAITLFSLPSFLFFFLAFSAFQVFYLERSGLSLQAGDSPTASAQS
jgi:hypothetical protein